MNFTARQSLNLTAALPLSGWVMFKNHHIIFTAALLTIAKVWKPRKCPFTDERIKWCARACTRTHTDTRIVFSHKKEFKLVMDRPREH